MKTLADFKPPVDPIYGASGYEREEGDRYWTEPWITTTLLRNWGLPNGRVWEPAAGRGDIVNVLQEFGFDTYASDIDMSAYLGPDPCVQFDFLKYNPALDDIPKDVKAIVTNPPYKGELADRFVSKAHALIEWGEFDMAAFLLRSEWNHAKKRVKFFDSHLYAGEIVLRKRPRWDWWYANKPISAPRHNFSWFVWDRRDYLPLPTKRVPVQLFQTVDE